MLVLLFVALRFIQRGDLLYVLPCVILFLCFSVLLVLRLPRLGKRELILVLLVRLIDLCLFGFVGFLFLLGSGKGCGLWLWHSLDFSLTFFWYPEQFETGYCFIQTAYEYQYYRITSYNRRLWRQITNETTDVNIVDIKRVCEESVPVKIKNKFDFHTLWGYHLMFEEPAVAIWFNFSATQFFVRWSKKKFFLKFP